MLRNYLITTLRNLKRNKVFTLLNVLGLALGIGCAIVLFKIITFELSYDDFHEKKERIYRIVAEIKYAGNIVKGNQSPSPTAKALKNDFAEVEAAAMVNFTGASNYQITVTDKLGERKVFIEEGLAFAEPDVFKILDFEWLAGNPEGALEEPRTVVLSRKIAEKYFGIDQGFANVLGEIITFQNTHDLTIIGVIEDQPMNTNFPFEMIAHFYDLEGVNPYFQPEGWETMNGGTECYLLLPEGHNEIDFERQLPDFVDKYNRSSDTFGYHFEIQPLNDIHFNTDYYNYTGRVVPNEMVVGLTLIGIFLVLIACVNFINLSTAQAAKRSKEIGIRKVLGVVRKQLAAQFLGETMFISFMSMLLALAIAEVLLITLEDVLTYRLSIGLFSDTGVLIFLVMITALVGILSGFYPALLLSRMNPINALRKKYAERTSGGLGLRRGLVIFQFGISQVFIIGTLIIMTQIEYFLNKDLGFNKQSVVISYLPELDSLKRENLKTQIEANASVEKVSFSLGAPTAQTNNTNTFTYEPAGADNRFNVNVKDVDENYIELFGLELLAGQNLRRGQQKQQIVVNEDFVRAMGIYDPQQAIGESITLWNRSYAVMGVVKDFHIYNLRRDITPLILRYDPTDFWSVSVRMKGTDENTVDYAWLDEVWMKVYPEYAPNFQLLNDRLTLTYQREQSMMDLVTVFAMVAVFISCLGLYGLISFIANQKTKEIGIRKVLGARVFHILRLFTSELFYLLLIASIIAIPISYLALDDWLSNYPYNVGIGAGTIIMAVGVTMAIALVTMSYQSLKASYANPVDSLKDE